MDKNQIEVTRLNEQIADLKAELVELSGKLSDGIDDTKKAAQTAMGTISENPGTISLVAVTAGLVGLAVGYVLSSRVNSGRSWHL